MHSSPLRRIASLLLPLGLLISGSASAQVQVSLIKPDQALIERDFELWVDIQSVYQLSSVQAEFGGKVFPMPVSPRSTATVSIDGVPYGEHLLTVTARDIQGTEGRVSRLLQVDRPPRLTISSPMHELVARPTARLTASCEDDGPQECEVIVDVRVKDPRQDPRTNFPSPPNMRAPGGIDQELCLTEYVGRQVHLSLYARAGAQSSDRVERIVHVEDSQRLAPVVSVPGAVLDFDARQVLFVDEQRRARVLDRASGQSETLLEYLTGNGYDCGLSCIATYDLGHLAPGGAVFGIRNVELIQVKDGQRSSLMELPFRPNGAIFPFYRIAGNQLTYYVANRTWALRDLATGTTVQIPSGFEANWLGEDGTVVGSNDNQLLRYRNGQVEQVFTETAGDVLAPIAKGDDYVYQLDTGSSQETVLLRGGQRHVLADTSGLYVSPLLAKGWVAFVRRGGDVAQVWLRSPADVEEQVSSWGLPSAPRLLGPDGRVVYETGSRYYLAGPGSPPVPFATAKASLLKELDGRVHMALGNTVFRVEPEASAEPLACPSAPPPPPEEPSEPEAPKEKGCAAAGSGSAWLSTLTLLALVTRRVHSRRRRCPDVTRSGRERGD